MISVRGVPARSLFALVTIALILVLACFVLFAPPDGNERAQLLQFFGRFHPLSVHLPIALLILVPLLELAGRTRHFPYLLPAAPFVLGVALCGAIAAAALGWCLARGGAYSGPLITQHMWAALVVAGAAWLCWILRTGASTHASTTAPHRLYAVTLIAAVGLVSFTGYRGGQLSQGENHLTEFMPPPFDSWLGPAAQDAPANSPNGGPSTFYGARIQPVLAQHCITCHGRSKHKANLRLDYYEAVMRGGKHGPVIKAGDLKASELLHRITLPPTDEAFMPADNKRPVSASDIKLIEQWIAAGASGTLAADAVKDVAPASAPAPEVAFEELDPAAVAKQRSSLASAVAQFQQRLPNVLDYQSRGSADLVVNAAWMGAKFGDNELAALAPLNERIVMADFSNTAITDKSSAALAAMKNLRTLRLMHTKITDTTVQAIASLNQLETLSLFDTPVTSSALSALARLPKLQRVYAGQTKLTAAAIPQEIRDKVVF
jgi:uncharacterized membrane protein